MLEKLRRDPPFTSYVYELWALVPSLTWFAVIFVEYLVVSTLRSIH